MAQKDQNVAVFMKNFKRQENAMKVDKAREVFEGTRAKYVLLGCPGLGHPCCIFEAWWKHDFGTWCASVVHRTLVAVQWTQVSVRFDSQSRLESEGPGLLGG